MNGYIKLCEPINCYKKTQKLQFKSDTSSNSITIERMVKVGGLGFSLVGFLYIYNVLILLMVMAKLKKLKSITSFLYGVICVKVLKNHFRIHLDRAMGGW